MRQKGRVGGAGILKELSSARGKTQDSVMVRLPGLYGNKKKILFNRSSWEFYIIAPVFNIRFLICAN